jgi:predicted enzyme related to lactoylglutathione lyase
VPDDAPVRQLRLVLTVDDVGAAVAFYADALGLPEFASFADPEGRVVILDAGRATVEITDRPHAEYVDRVEGVERRGTAAAGGIRVAFEVTDAEGTTRRLEAAGARVIAEPVRTPWNSLNARLDGPDGLELTVFENRTDEA